MRALVGYTGFVGSNIYAAGEFDAVYHSKNIKEAYGTNPKLLIYAGLRAEKYLANNEPERDMELILEAEANITKINPQRLVLISTIDVFQNPAGVDEASEIDIENLHAYGYNRYQLEAFVRAQYPEALIIRLPGLFGKNIKKNFIYDYINVIPFMLKAAKLDELAGIDPELKHYYQPKGNGFYQVNIRSEAEREILKRKFRQLGFSALNFTDSRSIYQFYHLKRLWSDIQIALDAGITLLHTATEPVSAGELYEYLSGEKFVNELEGIPARYDYRTRQAAVYGGKNGYIETKQEVLSAIRDYVQAIS